MSCFVRGGGFAPGCYSVPAAKKEIIRILKHEDSPLSFQDLRSRSRVPHLYWEKSKSSQIARTRYDLPAVELAKKALDQMVENGELVTAAVCCRTDHVLYALRDPADYDARYERISSSTNRRRTKANTDVGRTATAASTGAVAWEIPVSSSGGGGGGGASVAGSDGGVDDDSAAAAAKTAPAGRRTDSSSGRQIRRSRGDVGDSSNPRSNPRAPARRRHGSQDGIASKVGSSHW